MPHTGISSSPRPVAFGSATVSNAAKAISHEDFGFSAAQLAEANRAVISAHAQPIHFRYDGGAPTATIGHHADDSTENAPRVVLGNANVQALQFIREGGTDSVVSVTLEKV